MRHKKLKIIFVGIPDMGTICLDNLLKSNFDVVGVVPPKKNHETYSFFKDYVIQKGLNFLEFENSSNDEDYIEKIKKLNADIGVVCSYNYKLSRQFLSSTKMGYINCHPSFLPDYRGAMPYFHIINNNEKESGITLHLMDENFDTGNIIYQEKFQLTPDETMGIIFNRTTYMISDALIKVLNEIEKTGKVTSFPQDNSKKYKQAPRINGVYKINWNSTISEIDSLIRACNPFYNAYSYFRGVNFRIIKARKLLINHNFECGKIVKADLNELIVAAKDGYVLLDVFQVGTWGIFQPRDFYMTFSPTTDEFLK